MKNSRQCPKCGGSNIVVIQNDGHPDGTYGNNIMCGATTLSKIVFVERFITGSESFWKNWACHRNVMLVVSGSAASWMRDKLINNHGGLYGRVTWEIKLEPFNLKECELLFKENKINLSRYDIVQSYMIFGGIPYYMGYFKRGRSLAQNVDDLLFAKGAKLSMEYDRLFASVFTNPDMMKAIIKALKTRTKKVVL